MAGIFIIHVESMGSLKDLVTIESHFLLRVNSDNSRE